MLGSSTCKGDMDCSPANSQLKTRMREEVWRRRRITVYENPAGFGMLMSMIRFRSLAVLLMVSAAGCSTAAQPGGRFNSEIEAFEKQDAKSPPPPAPILFVGSSTIRFWETSKAFPNLPVLNRGVGGSEISDVLFYYDRIVLRYRPRTIVFYSGDNDLAVGKSVEQVVSDMHEFINKVHADLPNTKLVVIAIKPSIARWKMIDSFRKANHEIEKIVKEKHGDLYVDVEPQVLGPNGKPRPELYWIDGLHFNEKGYAILDAAVKPYIAMGN